MIVIDDALAYILLAGLLTAIAEFVIILILALRTPAFSFLFKKGVIFNPLSSKIAEFLAIKSQHGKLAKTKKGFFFTKPDDFFIEKKSKTPISIAYSNYAMTFNPKTAKITEMLRLAGINNYNELMKFVKDHKKEAKEQFPIGQMPNQLAEVSNNVEQRAKE